MIGVARPRGRDRIARASTVHWAVGAVDQALLQMPIRRPPRPEPVTPGVDPQGDAEPGPEVADGSRSPGRPCKLGLPDWQRERCCEPVEDNHGCAIYRQMRAGREVLRASQQTPLEGATAHLASAGDSLAAAAVAALADLDGVPDGMPGLARPKFSQSRRTPGRHRPSLAGRTRDHRRRPRRAVRGQPPNHPARHPGPPGAGHPAPWGGRRRRSQRTRAQYAAIYRGFLAWLADELGRPPTRQDLSGDVLAPWIARRASVGGHGGRGLSSASLRLECSALRRLDRHAGRPELAASLHASRQQAPRRRPSHVPSTSGRYVSPT
jgi:hypothetical protein